MAILFAWIAALASTATPLIVKNSGGTLIRSPWLFNVLWSAAAVPLGVAFGLTKEGIMPENWTPLLLASAASALFFIFYTLSIFRINVSVMSPLFSLRVVFATVLGAALLDEHISLVGLALISTVVLLSPLASFDESLKLKAFFQPGVLLALVAMVSLAFVGVFANKSVEANGFGPTLIWQDGLTSLMLLPTLFATDFKKERFTKRVAGTFAVLGLLSGTYTVTSTEAFARNLAISSVIISIPLSMIAAVLLSKKLPKLKETHSQKVYTIRFVAATIMISCAVALSLLSNT